MRASWNRTGSCCRRVSHLAPSDRRAGIFLGPFFQNVNCSCIRSLPTSSPRAEGEVLIWVKSLLQYSLARRVISLLSWLHKDNMRFNGVAQGKFKVVTYNCGFRIASSPSSPSLSKFRSIVTIGSFPNCCHVRGATRNFRRSFRLPKTSAAPVSFPKKK